MLANDDGPDGTVELNSVGLTGAASNRKSAELAFWLVGGGGGAAADTNAALKSANSSPPADGGRGSDCTAAAGGAAALFPKALAKSPNSWFSSSRGLKKSSSDTDAGTGWDLVPLFAGAFEHVLKMSSSRSA